MTTRVLVPVDNSRTSRRTVEAIIAEKGRFADCSLSLLHVVAIDELAYRMIPDFQLDMVREQASKAGEQLLQAQMDLFAEAGLTSEGRLEFGSPREILCQIANEEDFELLIIGRRTTGEIRDVLFGSVANYALHNVRCPVLLF